MKTIFIVLVTMTVLILAFYAYFDGFKRITVSLGKQGGEFLVYFEQTGDYRNSSILIDKLYYSLLQDEGVETFKGFGIFYDDPTKVERSMLRSEVGCILEDPSIEVLEKLAGRYKLKLLPKKDFIVAEFTYKGKISVITGSKKVYTAMTKYMKENGLNEKGPVMEIYDIPGKKILYRKELMTNK